MSADILKEDQSTHNVINKCCHFSLNTTRQCVNFQGLSSSSGKQKHKQHRQNETKKYCLSFREQKTSPGVVVT